MRTNTKIENTNANTNETKKNTYIDDQENLRDILQKVASGTLSINEAETLIRKDALISVEDFLAFDQYRENRRGIPEVVFSESKSIPILIKIIEQVVPKKKLVFFTRLTNEQREALKKFFSINNKNFDYEIDDQANTCIVRTKDYPKLELVYGPVVILTAGTSDIPVAREAQITLELMGVKTLTTFDVGIAGLHRLIEPLKKFLAQKPVCIIVCAGMEGALPSVVAGLVDVPIIGVPVKTGYGYGGQGQGALMTMLQSCSPGLAVVNIDAGFSAGAIAALIAKRIKLAQ